MQETAKTENRNRQEQILLLAAEGLTDKEIAARLGLSPETVGTYWRRILAKYQACSRTEVVAKVLRLQSQASMGQLEELNQCLREVTDHLLSVVVDRENAAAEHPLERVFAALPDLVVQVDAEGFVLFSNAEAHGLALPMGDAFEWSVDPSEVEDLRQCLGRCIEETASTECQIQVRGQRMNTRVVPFEKGALMVLTKSL